MTRLTFDEGPEVMSEGAYFSLSPDGQYVVVSKHTDETKFDVWYRSMDGTGAPKPIVQTASSELDVSADAERFLLVAPYEEAETLNGIKMVENWYAEFAER